jgi:hypothetical protein
VTGEEQIPERNLYIALLHHPVYDKNGQVVTTCTTNLDLHDISRISKTYELARFFVVQPIPSQRALIERIMHHWTEGFGARYNVTRKEAFESITLCTKLGQAVEQIQEEWNGTSPTQVVTTAGRVPGMIAFADLREKILQKKHPYLLQFGTGWGLTEETIQEADKVLEPVQGFGTYNHLSVRSAVSIVVDRLLGDRNNSLCVKEP